MYDTACPHNSGVEQQHPMSHNNTETPNASDLAIPSADPMTMGAPIHMMSGDKWTGRLFSNGTSVYAQAHAKEAIRNPYANAFVTL
jgi:hypothetical protein